MLTTPTIRLAAAVIFVVILSACGARMPTSPSISIAGQWQGTIASAEDGPGTIAMTLAQDGQSVSGSVLLSQSGLADIPGTLTGTLETSSGHAVLQFTVAYQFGFQCQGSFGGKVSVTASEIDGAYGGQNCVHAFGGTLRVTKAE